MPGCLTLLGATDEPMAALKLFKALHAAEKEKQAVFPKPIIVTGFNPVAEPELDADGSLDDEDYIDMHKPVLRRSK